MDVMMEIGRFQAQKMHEASNTIDNIKAKIQVVWENSRLFLVRVPLWRMFQRLYGITAHCKANGAVGCTGGEVHAAHRPGSTARVEIDLDSVPACCHKEMFELM